jgi:hypothetical protein
MKLINIVFKDEKVLKVFKDVEDAFDFIADELKSETANFRVEEFIVD